MAESAGLIGAAVKTALDAALSGWTVVRRKKPDLAPRDPRPIAVVCVGEEGDVEHVTAGANPWDMVTYPVGVSVYLEGGEKLKDDDSIREVRAIIRRILNRSSTYSTVPGFNDVTAGGGPPFSPGALATNNNLSTLYARVQVLESRS